MKKLLYFVQLPPPVHGVSTMNQYITQSELINKDFETYVLPIKFSSTIEDLRKKKFKKIFTSIALFFKLLRTVKRFKPDLVYFSLIPVGSGFLRDAFYIVLLRTLRVKIICHFHNRGVARNSKKWIWRKFYRVIFYGINLIHLSEGLMKSEIDSLNIKNVRTFVVYNTVKSISSNRSKKESGFFDIMFFSNLVPGKGLDILFESLQTFWEKENIRLQIYGATFHKKETGRFEKYVHEKNLSDRVIFHGPVYGDEKNIAFANADLFVFPSYFREECFPLSLLEAMQAALPIVATRIGAIPEIIDEGKEGILIDCLDSDQLSRAIQTLIGDKDLRLNLGLNAQRRFRKEFAMEHFEKRMRSVLMDVFSIEMIGTIPDQI